jgi:hypothetical protein
MNEQLIRDWFESIKKNLPKGATIDYIRKVGDRTWITYEYGTEQKTKYMNGKKHGQIEVTQENITCLNRENKLRDLGL